MDESRLYPGSEEENIADKALKDSIALIQRITLLAVKLKNFFSEEEDIFIMISRLIDNYKAIKSVLDRIKELYSSKLQKGQDVILVLNEIEKYLQSVNQYWQNIESLWQDIRRYLKKHKKKAKDQRLLAVLQNIANEEQNFWVAFLTLQRRLGYNNI